MRRHMLGILAIVVWLAPAASARAESADEQVRQRLGELQSLLARGPHASGWVDYLKLNELESQFASGEPDPRVVARSIGRLRSGQPGVELKPMVALRKALERWAVQSEAYQQQLPALVREARFSPPSEAQVGQRRQQLNANLASLEQRLSRSAQGAGWRRFLQLDALKDEIARDGEADIAVLEETLRRFESGHQGLEMPMFRDVATSLRAYVTALRAIQTPDLQAMFQQRIDALATALEQQTAGELPNLAPVIDNATWLAESGVSPDAVRTVESRFPFKNLFVTVSDDVIRSGYAQQQTDVQTIRENVEGTQVSGTATTQGTLTVRLVPSESQALWDALFQGQTASQTLGRNRSARIGLVGHTELTGVKRIVLDSDGPRALPATATASTDLVNTGIGSSVGGIRGCVVQRVASRRVAESLPRAERSTSQRAESELRNRLEERAKPQIADANRQFWQRFRQPLAAKGLFPDDLLFSTTSRYLSASGTFTGPARLGAPSLPPVWTEVADLGLIAHETAINSMAQAFLAGQTFESENVRSEMGDMLGSLPDRFAQDEEGEPWSITFADRDPITVSLRDDGMTITVRGQRYTSGDRGYRAMNVTANYAFELCPEGMDAVRKSELEIFPPGFVPGERRLSVAEQTLRRMLERRMGKIFAEQLGLAEVVLPRDFAKAGPLSSTQLRAQNGWLLAAWRQREELPEMRTAGR